MEIVQLTRDNVAYAVSLAKEMHAISTFAVDGPPFDWAYTLHNMVGTIGQPDYHFSLALDDTGEYCGAVCGRVTPYYFSPKLQGIEEAWYVREGTHERTKIAKALMQRFVGWALDEKGALMVQSGDVAAISSQAVDALYKHLGFKRYGSAYRFARTTP